MWYSAEQCSAVQGRAVQCSAVHGSAVQCRAVQCSAVPCSAVQCITVQYSEAKFNSSCLWLYAVACLALWPWNVSFLQRNIGEPRNWSLQHYSSLASMLGTCFSLVWTASCRLWDASVGRAFSRDFGKVNSIMVKPYQVIWCSFKLRLRQNGTRIALNKF